MDTHIHSGDHYTDRECPCGSLAGKPVSTTQRILSGSDPSWHERYLAIIDRDYPAIAWEILSKAQAENVADIETRKAGA